MRNYIPNLLAQTKQHLNDYCYKFGIIDNVYMAVQSEIAGLISQSEKLPEHEQSEQLFILLNGLFNVDCKVIDDKLEYRIKLIKIEIISHLSASINDNPLSALEIINILLRIENKNELKKILTATYYEDRDRLFPLTRNILHQAIINAPCTVEPLLKLLNEYKDEDLLIKLLETNAFYQKPLANSIVKKYHGNALYIALIRNRKPAVIESILDAILNLENHQKKIEILAKTAAEIRKFPEKHHGKQFKNIINHIHEAEAKELISSGIDLKAMSLFEKNTSLLPKQIYRHSIQTRDLDLTFKIPFQNFIPVILKLACVDFKFYIKAMESELEIYVSMPSSQLEKLDNQTENCAEAASSTLTVNEINKSFVLAFRNCTNKNHIVIRLFERLLDEETFDQLLLSKENAAIIVAKYSIVYPRFVKALERSDSDEVKVECLSLLNNHAESLLRYALVFNRSLVRPILNIIRTIKNEHQKVEILMDANAKGEGSLSIAAFNSSTFLHDILSLIHEMKEQQNKLILLSQRNCDGETPLHLAVRFNNRDGIKAIINAFANLAIEAAASSSSSAKQGYSQNPGGFFNQANGRPEEQENAEAAYCPF